MSSSTSSGTDLALRDSAVYMTASGELQLDVPIDSETVWLTQAQMAKLFGSSQRMMSYHIGNVFSEGELERKSNIQKMYVDRSKKPISLHSLNVIISVGYRVKSPSGVHFRQWATSALRERLLSAHRQRQLEQMRWQGLGEIVSHVENKDEARALLDVIERYANSWRMLLEYDENRLPDRPASPTTKRMKRLTLKQARAAIVGLRNDQIEGGEAGTLFGIERDKSLEGLLGNIEQTFDGRALYPSVE